MKKLVLVGLVLLASVMVLLPLVGCDTNAGGDKPSSTDTSTQQPSGDGGNGTEVHEHSFAEEWTYNGKYHWKTATCEHTGEVSEEAEHTFGDWKTTESPTEERKGRKERVCGVCSYSEIKEIEKVPAGFVYIPEGSFQMGSEAGSDSNKTVHTVKISNGFFMGKYEVTQLEYLEVMGKWGGTEPSETYGKGNNYPAYYVSWYDAVVYCNKRSIAEELEPVYKKGDETDPAKWGNIPANSVAEWNNITCNWNANGYRLPTEAEWEYAARGGNGTTKALIWSGTDKEDELGNYAWYYDNSENKTHEVGTRNQNGYGLYDMSGNVWEWCWDRYAGDYYKQTEGVSDPKGASSGSYRVNRGGSLLSLPSNASVSLRNSKLPYDRLNSLGFRVVCASSK
ncbi:MAG: formylglycine-generating enzyme family protein [Treponema sp.]|nr:formylglycine-generating enzyme family protein [Treponema sp.]